MEHGPTDHLSRLDYLEHSFLIEKLSPLHPFGGRYKTKDNRYLILAIIDANKEWPKLLKALDIEYFNEDPRFSSFKKMNENFMILYEEREKIFIQYSLKEITEKLRFSEVTFGVT